MARPLRLFLRLPLTKKEIPILTSCTVILREATEKNSGFLIVVEPIRGRMFQPQRKKKNFIKKITTKATKGVKNLIALTNKKTLRENVN